MRRRAGGPDVISARGMRSKGDELLTSAEHLQHVVGPQLEYPLARPCSTRHWTNSAENEGGAQPTVRSAAVDRLAELHAAIEPVLQHGFEYDAISDVTVEDAKALAQDARRCITWVVFGQSACVGPALAQARPCRLSLTSIG